MSEPDESLMVALAEFAAGAGHEINNPLAIISGHAQILLEKAQSPEERRRLASILSQTKRAYEMIADVRLFACPPNPVFQDFNLDEFLESLAADYASHPTPLEIRTIWNSSFTGEPHQFQSDPQILRMVFDSLLKNSMESNQSPYPTIHITPIFEKKEKQHWLLFFNDHGSQIPQEYREKIFFPYFSGRTYGRGLGFGLPRSWALMRKLGGSISYDEEKGFVIKIPVL